MAPASGAYLLIVVSDPISQEHKQVILKQMSKGLLSWDLKTTGCDLTSLQNVCASVKDKPSQNSDLLIQYSTEGLGVEVLVSPPVSTLKQCLKNLLVSSIGYKHIIHAGYTFSGSGSWILQNGTFSFDEFLSAFQDAEVQSQKGCTIHVHCAEVGQWTSSNFSKEVFTKVANVCLNPPDQIDYLPGSEYLFDCLQSVLQPQSLTEIMEATPLVGNIRFHRPTLYLFPAGQGDCALFGINGFNMLIDGGFNRKPCSWEFIRHLDRLDAVLVTRLSESNLCSMSTLMSRKTLNNTYPHIGYVFCNIAEAKSDISQEEELKDKNDLLVSVVGEGHNFIRTLNELKLIPHQCWRDNSTEPFVLYHKVGHGTLEMYVLSPPKDSKEMKDFLSEWCAYKEKFSCVKSGLKDKSLEAAIPLSHVTSVCAIIVWRPADPKDTITRILFPGSAPQSKILESLEKLKNLDVLKQPTVTKATLSSAVLAKPKSKINGSITKASIPNRKNTASPSLSVSSVASKNGDIAASRKETPKDLKKDNRETKEVKKDIRESKEIKKDVKKEVKATTEKKTVTKVAQKKTESSLKSATEIKKTATVKKTTGLSKKEVSTKNTSTVKSTEKAEVRKSVAPKANETKVAKEVSNKKVAEVKAVSKVKHKPAASASKPSPKTEKIKPTPVPKSPSKITRAIAASAAVATAAVASGVAEFIEKKAEDDAKKEKEEIVAEYEAEEKEKVEITESVPNGIAEDKENNVIQEINAEEEIGNTGLRPEVVSPALSEPVSLTASDTISSAPLETVSPTPPIQDIASPLEEKEVNEIKEIEQSITPLEKEEFNADNMSEHSVSPIMDNPEPLDEHAVIKESLEDSPYEVATVDSKQVFENETEDAILKVEKTSDLMSASFVGSPGELVEEKLDEKFAQEEELANAISKKELLTNEESSFKIYEDEPQEHIVTGLNQTTDTEQKSGDKHFDEQETKDKNFVDINVQLASASMEGSFCEGLLSHDKVEENNGINEPKYCEEIQKTVTYTEESENININVSEELSTQEQFDIKEEYAMDSIRQHEEINICEQPTLNETDEEDRPETIQASEIQTENLSITRKETEETESVPDEERDCLKSVVSCKEEVEILETGVSEKEEYDDDDMQYSDKNSENISDQQKVDNISSEMSDFALQNIPKEEPSSLTDLHNHHDVLSHDDFSANESIEKLKDTSRQEMSFITESDSSVEIIDAREKEPIPFVTHVEETNTLDTDIISNKDEVIDELQPDMADQDNVEREEFKNITSLQTLSVDVKKQDLESDDDDVVKSPTPHAIVDYAGQLDDAIKDANESNSAECMKKSSENQTYADKEKERYPSEEKQDFNEKDRDSAEDEEEMIRHPTPPGEEAYYQNVGLTDEDEMKDPITQHFITTPSFRAKGIEATDEPLYEEPEDFGSERSQSPVIEQPVYGNVDKVDFPELVNVSGGTTPSEPQSPKSPHDSKKGNIGTLGVEVMEALSEHDCSESSTHSPISRDGPNAFDDIECESQDQVEQHVIEKDEFSLQTEPSSHYEEDLNAEHKQYDVELSQEKSVLKSHEITEISQDFSKFDPKDKIEAEVLQEVESSLCETEMKTCDSISQEYNSHFEAKSHDESDIKKEIKETDSYCEKSSQDHCEPPSKHCDPDSPTHCAPEGDYQSDTHFELCSNYQLGGHSNSSSEHATDLDTNIEKQSDDHFESNSNISHTESMLYSHMKAESSYSEESKYPLETGSELPVEESEIQFKIQNKLYSETDTCYQSQTESNEEYQFATKNSNEIKFEKNFNDDSLLQYPIESEASNIQEVKVDEELDFSDEAGVSHAAESEMHCSTYNTSHFEQISEHVEETTTILKQSEHILSEHQNVSSLPSDYDNEGKEYGEIPPPPLSEEYGNVEQLTDIETNHSFQNDLNFGTPYISSSNIESIAMDNDCLAAVPAEFVDKGYNENESEVTGTDPADYISSKTVSVSETTSEFERSEELQYSQSSIVETVSQNNLYRSENHCIENQQIIQGQENADFISKLSNQNSEYDTEEYKHEIRAYSSKIESLHSNGFSSEVEVHMSSVQYENDDEHRISESLHGVNGKYSESWKNSTQEYSEAEALHKNSFMDTTYVQEISKKIEKNEEECYAADSRFQSDSPEDNIMKNDLSPEVPVDVETQFSENISNFKGSEKFNELASDNLNFISGMSTDNVKYHEKKHEDPYGESDDSDEEDSSSLHGTVSPYAYTNKAYTQEEDIDGNHLYKESLKIKQVSEVVRGTSTFDGNNPQDFTENNTSDTHSITTAMSYPPGFPDVHSADPNYDFHVEEWGKPMGLPTPPETMLKTAKKPVKTSVSSGKTLTKTPDKKSLDNGKSPSAASASKLTSSPVKKISKTKDVSANNGLPVYVDLAYVPHHGDPHYCDVEFFKKIRARYYVFSGINPSKEVLNALLEAKKSWNEDLDVTIIPTYETDTLGYWMAQNQDALTEYSIEVAPSASRCTVNLQDHETSCAAYRLEF